MFESVCCYITNVCNTICDYCFRLDSDKKYMDIETFKNVLNKLKELGCKRLAITGGEPTLHPNIKEMINLAYDNGFYVDLITNGILVDLDDPIYQKISIICLSLDGVTDIGNQHRQKVQMESTKKIIEQYKSKDYPFTMKVSSVVTRSNYNEMIELGKNILNDKRIIWRLFKCRTYGDYNKLDPKELLNNEELQELINDIENDSFECKVYLKGLIDELKEVSKHVLINTNSDIYINEYLVGNLLKDDKKELEEKCRCYYTDNFQRDILIKWRK